MFCRRSCAVCGGLHSVITIQVYSVSLFWNKMGEQTLLTWIILIMNAEHEEKKNRVARMTNSHSRFACIDMHRYASTVVLLPLVDSSWVLNSVHRFQCFSKSSITFPDSWWNMQDVTRTTRMSRYEMSLLSFIGSQQVYCQVGWRLPEKDTKQKDWNGFEMIAIRGASARRMGKTGFSCYMYYGKIARLSKVKWGMAVHEVCKCITHVTFEVYVT